MGCGGGRYALFYSSAEGFFEAGPDGYTRPPKTFTPSDLEAFAYKTKGSAPADESESDASAVTVYSDNYEPQSDTKPPTSDTKPPTAKLVRGLTWESDARPSTINV